MSIRFKYTQVKSLKDVVDDVCTELFQISLVQYHCLKNPKYICILDF